MPDFDLFIANRTVAAMEGETVRFSDDDLRGIAERYDPALYEAPLIVGHPQHDAPAYGWVQGLSFADGRLQASEHQVMPEFAEMRKQGRFKKLSARFFAADHPNNPTPGHLYLRDVGFLGAMAPAVKGLRTYSFGDGAGRLVSCELSFGDLPAWGGSAIARLLGRLRDWLIDQSGADAADRVLPAYEIENLRELSQRAAESPAAAPDLRSFADPGGGHPGAPTSQPQEQSTMTDAEKAELEAARRQAAELEAENARLKGLQAKAEADKRHAANLSFADSLVKDRRWASGDRDRLVAALDQLSAPINGNYLSFGDGDAAEPLHEAMRRGLRGLPQLCSEGAVATKAAAAAAASGQSDREIAESARTWKFEQERSGRHVSFADAVRHVTTANTDL